MRRFINKLEANKDKDPKYELVLTLLKKRICTKGMYNILQYYDSALWVASEVSKDLDNTVVGYMRWR